MDEKNFDAVCMTDGDFFKNLFEMEARIIAEVDEELAMKKETEEK